MTLDLFNEKGDVMNRRGIVLITTAFVLILSSSVFGQISARLLQYPDVSGNQITFEYAGDIWVVPITGGAAHRLSTPPGIETFPRFSPDGSEIAYTANYEGNEDIYVIPTGGGLPKRLTHHPMTDRMLGWYPDGKSILYASSMESGRQRFNQFYHESVQGGLPEKLPVPYGEFGAISPDGKYLAYIPKSRDFRTWKGYRGGWAPDIWMFNLQDSSAKNITDNQANDSQPMWHGSTLYFLSDRGPSKRFNIWAYDTKTESTREVTHFSNYDIHFPGIGPNNMVFESGDSLYVMDLNTEKYKPVTIHVVTDQLTLMPKTEDVSNRIMDYNISPAGKRALFDARGDVFSLPAGHGVITDFTQTSGIAERYPSWSPDGKYLAYWSDQSGEYELTVRNQGGNGDEQQLSHLGAGFRYHLFWSPDSKKLVYVDQTMKIHLFDREKKKDQVIDQGLWMYEGSLESFKVSWSSDGQWIAYSRGLGNRHDAVFLYNTKTGNKSQVTSGFYDDSDPVFDPDAKYIYFLTNQHFDPVYSSVQSTWVYPNSTQIAAVALRPDVPSPLAPQNDSLTVKTEKPKEEKKSKKKETNKSNETKTVNIALQGFEQRAVILPPEAGNYTHLEAVSGKVIYQHRPNSGSKSHKSSLSYWDLKTRKEKSILSDVSSYRISADGNKILARSGKSYAIVDVAPDQKMDKTVPVDKMNMTIDPRAEWHQIFNDAWRMVRDYFYDPNLHGVDWKAEKAKYEKLLDYAVTRTDVNYVIGELIAELNSSHTYRFGGDMEHAEHRNVGLLGIDWELDHGYYRIQKIIHGAPWDNETKSPLDEPGIKAKDGDYVLAVNRNSMDTSKDPWASFQGMAGETIELTLNSKPSMDGSWNVLVKPLDNDTRLRHLAWINHNRETVEKESDGKLGYIYVPNTGIDGQSELVRQFVAQYNKQGLIIDERFNSGGQIPDRFIELLNRPALGFWAVRDGHNWQTPTIANFGPKVMLINGWSGSGGDAFPYFFKESKLGPLIGMRTWGGLIGYTGVPGLVDGGSITVPTFRLYNPEGKWFPEGHGVEPDIKVVDDPAQLSRGIDPQLQKAIQVELQQLKENPPVHPKQPPYQNRALDSSKN